MRFIITFSLAIAVFCGVSVEASSVAASPVAWGALDKKPYGCHYKNDRMGKTCQLHGMEFINAGNDFCYTYFSVKGETTIMTDHFIQAKMPHVDDGRGDEQVFWGQIQVDRGTTKMTEEKCKGHMEQIFKNCGGSGGWINTSYGTVFGECLRTS